MKIWPFWGIRTAWGILKLCITGEGYWRNRDDLTRWRQLILAGVTILLLPMLLAFDFIMFAFGIVVGGFVSLLALILKR